MKKILLLLALSGLTTTAFAQGLPGGPDSSKDYATGGTGGETRNSGFGVKGGYNLNQLRGDDISGLNRNSVSDFHAGVYGQLGFGSFSSIQAEILYSRMGFEANTGTNGANQKFRNDFLMLPVMYVGNFTQNLSFHVGPQVALLTKVIQDGNSLDIADNAFNSFNFGGVAGLEAHFGPARIGARYNLFLGKVFEDNPPTTAAVATRFGNADIYNNLYQVYVGIGIAR